MMLPVLGDRSSFGEGKRDDTRAGAAVPAGPVAELRGHTDKGNLFPVRAKLFCFPLSGVVFHTKPVSLCGQPPGEGPASRASSECATTQQRPARRFKGFLWRNPLNPSCRVGTRQADGNLGSVWTLGRNTDPKGSAVQLLVGSESLNPAIFIV